MSNVRMMHSQNTPAEYSPFSGQKMAEPVNIHEQHWRADIHVWYFNPWTGTKRHEDDVRLDPKGLLIRPDGEVLLATPKTEAVNHPAHYGGADNPYEAIKVIEAWGLGFNLGNTVKYISRAGKKDAIVQDLKKAAWYLEREIANLEKAQ